MATARNTPDQPLAITGGIQQKGKGHRASESGLLFCNFPIAAGTDVRTRRPPLKFLLSTPTPTVMFIFGQLYYASLRLGVSLTTTSAEGCPWLSPRFASKFFETVDLGSLWMFRSGDIIDLQWERLNLKSVSANKAFKASELTSGSGVNVALLESLGICSIVLLGAGVRTRLSSSETVHRQKPERSRHERRRRTSMRLSKDHPIGGPFNNPYACQANQHHNGAEGEVYGHVRRQLHHCE
jgi:hypothetical protein